MVRDRSSRRGQGKRWTTSSASSSTSCRCSSFWGSTLRFGQPAVTLYKSSGFGWCKPRGLAYFTWGCVGGGEAQQNPCNVGGHPGRSFAPDLCFERAGGSTRCRCWFERWSMRSRPIPFLGVGWNAKRFQLAARIWDRARWDGQFTGDEK